MNKLLKKLIGFSIGPIVGMIIGLITVPLTTYFILPNEYGKASLFATLQSIVMLVIYFGFDQSYVREYYETKERNKLISNCMAVPIFFSFLLFIFFPFYYRQLSNFLFEEVYILPIFLFVVSTLFMILERFILLKLRMEEKAILYSVITIIVKIINLIMVMIFIFFIRRDFLSIVYSTILSQILIDFALIICFKNKISFNLRYLDIALIVKLMKFGLPLAGVSIIGYLLNSIDTIFLRFFSSYLELGYYAVAAKITGFLVVIQSAFGTFWAPVSYRWYNEKKNYKLF